MDLYFTGNLNGLQDGLACVCAALDIVQTDTGHLVRISNSEDRNLYVSGNETEYNIRFGSRVQLFRAIGLIVENASLSSFKIKETPRFETNGVMIDVSQCNAVIKIKYMQMILDRMAIMGLNVLYLYMEDSFTIDDEPYFGYMRGRYSEDELRLLDDYAWNLGITIIPCVQTLAHLGDVLKWAPYQKIMENSHTLLVGEDATYVFIENLLKSITKPFRSKRIHIGMDEATGLGLGKYLNKNGYRPMFEIMSEHLNRVLEICHKLDIEPMIWSDMIIQAAYGNNTDLVEYYKTEHEIPQEILDKYPKEAYLVYWDYYHQTKEKYEELLKRHEKFTDKIVFAGGIWNWNSFTVDYDKTFATSIPALAACKSRGIKHVFATTWGDFGVESNVFSTLLGMQLFAEYGYADEVTEERLAARFLACTGCNYQDFRNMTYLDNPLSRNPEDGDFYFNSSRFLIWQDILAGIFDKNLEGMHLAEHFESVYIMMKRATLRNGDFSFVFQFLCKVADVLRLKAEMGLKIKVAYDEKNNSNLKNYALKDLPMLLERVKALYDYHRELWFMMNKPLGFEILDLRYGALISRINTAIKRISDYISGRESDLGELQEPRLLYNGKDGLPTEKFYSRIYSSSQI